MRDLATVVNANATVRRLVFKFAAIVWRFRNSGWIYQRLCEESNKSLSIFQIGICKRSHSSRYFSSESPRQLGISFSSSKIFFLAYFACVVLNPARNGLDLALPTVDSYHATSGFAVHYVFRTYGGSPIMRSLSLSILSLGLVLLQTPAFAWVELPSVPLVPNNYDQGQQQLDTVNYLACEAKIREAAKIAGVDVQVQAQSHQYPNGHVCTKAVAKFSSGKSCECYSPERNNCVN